jgi:rare lipoprotein A
LALKTPLRIFLADRSRLLILQEAQIPIVYQPVKTIYFSNRTVRRILFISLCILVLPSCGTLLTTYNLTKGTVKTTYKAAKFITLLGIGAVKMTYKIGEGTFTVVTAPLAWPMTNDIDSIDGLSPKEAVAQGRVKMAPYVVKGERYVPMSPAQAESYSEIGMASWYGDETLRANGGHMTANGEAFDPGKPTAAHKNLPLPIHVRVTNQSNGRSIIVRVNDRGPFVKGRIIDLTAGAAKKLGFYEKGTAKVLVETVEI